MSSVKTRNKRVGDEPEADAIGADLSDPLPIAITAMALIKSLLNTSGSAAVAISGPGPDRAVDLPVAATDQTGLIGGEGIGVACLS